MPGAARTTDATTAHSPCGPGQCSVGSPDVYINGLKAFRVDDKSTPHGVPEPDDDGGYTCRPHTSTLGKGSHNVYVNGKPLGRITDTFRCGIQVASGSGNVIVNG